MSTKLRHPSSTIDVVLAAAQASGAGLLVGLLFGVARIAGAIGETVTLDLEGVHELPKATGAAWVQGTTKLYWDDTAKNITHVSTSNTLVGVPYVAAGTNDTIGYVLLLPGIHAAV